MAQSETQSEELARRHSRRKAAAARALFGDLLQFAEFVGVIGASVAVAYVYHRVALQSEFDFQNYAAAGIIGGTGLTALLRRDGFYDFDQILTPLNAMKAVMSRWALVLLGLLAFGFALKISENFSRVWLFAWSLSSLGFLCATRLAAAASLRSMIRDGGAFSRRIAIVGATRLAEKFADYAGGVRNGVSIVGVFDAGIPINGEPAQAAPVGDLNALERIAREGGVDDIIIAAPRAEPGDMDRLIRRLSGLPISISICPNTHWLDHRGGEISRVGDVNVLSLYRRPLEGWGGVSKTIEDYALASIALIVLSPVIVLCALAIKLQDGGPILFVQKRHGFNNAVFRIYKFRTMTVAEDGDEIVQVKKNDPRVTPVGRFLRRSSLDELPQLFNVIGGSMSLVGPRPHALAHNHQYAQLIENYSGRHNVKPGITGWAQVNGYRGETSENELMEERVRYDLAYIDNWSLWFDFRILVMTALAVVFPKNAV